MEGLSDRHWQSLMYAVAYSSEIASIFTLLLIFIVKGKQQIPPTKQE